MFRDLLSSRLIQGGLVFFVLVAGISLLYSWRVRRSTEREMEPHTQFLQGIKQNKTLPAETVNAPTETESSSLVNTRDETTDTPMPDEFEEGTKDANEFNDIVDAFLPEDFIAEEEPAEEVEVSPYGFGPYPEVPVGMPIDMFPAPSANHELMRRVRIKLLSQGINVTGTTMEDGLIYPVIKGIGYVQWASYWRPTGKVTYISRFKGHPKDGARLDAIRFKKGKALTKTDVPHDIKLMSFEEGAIDPYQFLDIP